jgi:hypothetical protein
MGFSVLLSHLAQAQPSQPSTPDWGMLGVVIGTLSLLAAIIIGIAQVKVAQRPKKDIKCLIVSKVPLLRVDDRFRGQLQVSFQGKDIQDATSIILRVYNSGKLAITPNDFVRPIAFMVASNAEIINAEILKMEPENLGAKLSITKNNIELQPLLMNSDDTIDISTIVASFDNNIAVDGRVVDIKMIKLEEEDKTEDNKLKTLRGTLVQQLALLLITLLTALVSSFLGNAEIASILRKLFRN